MTLLKYKILFFLILKQLKQIFKKLFKYMLIIICLFFVSEIKQILFTYLTQDKTKILILDVSFKFI